MNAAQASFLRPFKKGLTVTTGAIGGVLLVVMFLLTIWQVFTRYVLNDPATFTEELVRYMLIWLAFIGGAYAFATRQHMALSLFSHSGPKRRQQVVKTVIDVLVLVFAVLILVVGGSRLALSAAPNVSALLGISRGIVYGMAPIAGVLIVLIQLVNIWEDVTGVELLDKEIEEEEL